MSLIELDSRNGVGIMTLADPGRRNAITLAMAKDIELAIGRFERDNEIHAIVVTGAGSAFCAGAHLDLVATGDPTIYRQLYRSFLRVAESTLPTIAAVNGPATGAGLNLVLCCDLRIAVTSARFAARFLDLGLHPGGGSTWMLSRAIGQQRAMAMMLCGDELDGDSAVAAGLVLRCVASEDLLQAAVALGARAAVVPRPVLLRAKSTMNHMSGISSLAEAVEIEATAQAWSATLPYFADRVKRTRLELSQRKSRRNEA